MKDIKYFLLLLIPLFLFIGCRSRNTAKSLTIYGLRGPSGIGMIKLFEEPPKINGFNVTVEALAQSDLMAARFISGEAKAGILPPNVAAKIFTSGAADLRFAAVTGAGNLGLLSSDPNVKSIADLKGKTVYATGHGAIVDYVFQRILRHYGLEPGIDVTLNYSLAYPEVAQSIIAGKISIALVPEPFATMARLGKPDLHDVCDVQQEWINTGADRNYPMTVLVMDGAFADANPDAVRIIAEVVNSSIQWVTANPIEAADLVEKHELAIRADVAAAAIPKSNYCFIPAMEAKSSLEAVFSIFLENDPASIGGALPADEFYLK